MKQASTLLHRIRDFGHDPGAQMLGNRFSCFEVLECAGIDAFDDNVVDLAFVPIVIDRENVWMIEAGDCLGLANKALAEPFFVRKIGHEDFDSYIALQGRLERPVNGGHPSLAQLFDDPILS